MTPSNKLHRCDLFERRVRERRGYGVTRFCVAQQNFDTEVRNCRTQYESVRGVRRSRLVSCVSTGGVGPDSREPHFCSRKPRLFLRIRKSHRLGLPLRCLRLMPNQNRGRRRLLVLRGTFPIMQLTVRTGIPLQSRAEHKLGRFSPIF